MVVEAPAAAAEVVADTDLLKVSECSQQGVSNSVAGLYRRDGVSHGRPVYRRFLGPWKNDAAIFYWDERDGLSESGWWIGDSVGSAAAWFYHPNRRAALPPAAGWNYNGSSAAVDEVLAVRKVSEAGASRVGALQKAGVLFGPSAIEFREVEVVEEEAAEVAGGGTLLISGCRDDNCRAAIAGVYHISGTNHGRPLYKRRRELDADPEVFIYYWDKRDGVSQCGWWIGRDVGFSEAWCHHPNRNAATPPKSDWSVPYDGPVDPSLSVSSKALEEEEAWSDRLQEDLIKTKYCCACGLGWKSGIFEGAMLYAAAACDKGWDMLVRERDYEACVVQEDFTEKWESISEQSTLHAAIDPDAPRDALWTGGERYVVTLRQDVSTREGGDLRIIVAKRFKKGLCIVPLHTTVVLGMYNEAIDPSQCELTCKKAVVKFVIERCDEWM